MSSLNKVMLIGNLGRDPEIRSTQQGNRIASFSIACSENWTDKQSGEKKERTEWVNVVIFNDNLVKIVEKYCNKGDKIFVEGKLQTRKWTDNAGQERYTTEVVLHNFDGKLVMLGSPSGIGNRRGGSEADPDYRAPARGRTPAQAAAPMTNDLDDDIPF